MMGDTVTYQSDPIVNSHGLHNAVAAGQAKLAQRQAYEDSVVARREADIAALYAQEWAPWLEALISKLPVWMHDYIRFMEVVYDHKCPSVILHLPIGDLMLTGEIYPGNVYVWPHFSTRDIGNTDFSRLRTPHLDVALATIVNEQKVREARRINRRFFDRDQPSEKGGDDAD